MSEAVASLVIRIQLSGTVGICGVGGAIERVIGIGEGGSKKMLCDAKNTNTNDCKLGEDVPDNHNVVFYFRFVSDQSLSNMSPFNPALSTRVLNSSSESLRPVTHKISVAEVSGILKSVDSDNLFLSN